MQETMVRLKFEFVWQVVELILSIGTLAFWCMMYYWAFTHINKLNQIWHWMWN